MIEFNNITAVYSEESGIFNLDFHVNKSELIFLMGPTGSGKSTVLNVINKKIKINSGSLIIDGKDVTKIKRRKIPYYRRKIGMIFQDYKLISDRTIFENISLPLQLIGVAKKDILYSVDQVLDKVSLRGVLDSFPNELSGGEQQRVSIARALINNPLLVLADEPTGNLDPNQADEIIDILENISNEGSTVLMSTHNYPLIKNRDKRFIELDNGRKIS
ncbi:MAG: cell division ATP-binding protein FtsE [Candidatus Marinimicrobia bacterium]|nr:cell division ATP-binding protein FtsE [Candidatus Neomarinimicrobiota bacterium]MAR30158.1 cell division ATP-binding protein FtsE [Candidatus Neomarinimicrobiota bacterium]|tara:strand:- start:3133 stop:3783 length:651 start_codon:yes stop_codon:yes gene_type:complete